MMQHLRPNREIWFHLIKFIRPEVATLTGDKRSSAILSVLALLMMLPVVFLGLLWLVWLTDWRLLAQQWPLFLLFIGLYALFDYLTYELQIELTPGKIESLTGSWDRLVLWSAMLIMGPTALWSGILVESALLGWRLRAEGNDYMRWLYIKGAALVLAVATIPSILGLLVYQQLGGVYPLPDLAWVDVFPAFVGLGVTFLSAYIIWFPAMLVFAFDPHLLSTSGEAGRNRTIQVMFLGVSLPGLSFPFAVLAAGLYGSQGLLTYLLFMAGALVAATLTHKLSQALIQSDQRSREMAALEKLGRDIILSPGDGSTLTQVLQKNLPLMFPRARIHIWLRPERVLYQFPESHFAEVESVHRWLNRSTAGYWFRKNVSVPKEEAGLPTRDGLVIPIQNEQDERIGGIYVLLRRRFGAVRDSLPAMQALASQIASALRRAELYQQTLRREQMARELEVAGRIQASFLPKAIPQVEGWDIAATLIPARETSGDFYDFIPLDEDGHRLGILIADVADKGTGAALYMALSRTLIRTFAVQYPTQPEQVLAQANQRILADTQESLFVTVFYGVLDTRTGQLTYSNAGHNPPYILSRTNPHTEHRLIRTGIPLGMFEDRTWERKEITLAENDVLLVYTDGIIEAQNIHEDFFGLPEFLSVSREHLSAPAQKLQQAILTAISRFVDRAPQFDDVTLMIITRQPQPPTAPPQSIEPLSQPEQV